MHETELTLPLIAPTDNPLVLTPLRAHYLKRELVTLEFINELSSLSSPTSCSLLGPPFLPASRFNNGVPSPAPPPGSPEALAEARSEENQIDLPFLRFVFNHFVLSFPFLANCPPTFFSHKLQPFVYSFVSRNISSSSVEADEGGREDGDTKRRKIAGKLEKHLGLIMSAAIKVTENEGREEVVRIEEDGHSGVALPASQTAKFGPSPPTSPPPPGGSKGVAMFGGQAAAQKKALAEAAFDINIVSVRNVTVKSRVRNKHHEEFIIRTRRKGEEDVFVARRYGDFTRLAQTVSCPFFFLPLAKLTVSSPNSSEPNASRRTSVPRRPKIAARRPSPPLPADPLSSPAAPPPLHPGPLALQRPPSTLAPSPPSLASATVSPCAPTSVRS